MPKRTISTFLYAADIHTRILLIEYKKLLGRIWKNVQKKFRPKIRRNFLFFSESRIIRT